MSHALPSRPADATLTVTKAARLLGVHPNTVRAWSDAGRLRYYRINPRGDRRYRQSDLQRFLAAAEVDPAEMGGVPVRYGPGGRRRAGFVLPSYLAPEPTGSPGQEVDGPVDDLAHASPDLALIDGLTRLAAKGGDLDRNLTIAATAVRDAGDHHLVAIWELRGERLVPRVVVGAAGTRDKLTDRPRAFGVLGVALADAVVGGERGRAATDDPDPAPLPILPGDRLELAAVIPGPMGPWGVLHVVAGRRAPLDRGTRQLVSVAADAIGTITSIARRGDDAARQLHRAEALRRVAGDIGSRLDLGRILAGLVDHAMVLFEGDRGAVFLRRPDGTIAPEVSRGLSTAYLAHIRDFPAHSLPAEAAAVGRPLFSVGYRDDPRGEDMRAAVIQEGYDTLCTAPLLENDQLVGLLNVYHDRAHAWSDDDLEIMAALAAQATVAIRAAQDYERMAAWAAQLQSIQQLGARLNRLSDVHEVGMAIATELHQLIDYHNVRVYRIHDEDLVPVAMKGQVGEYTDETPDMLRVKVGEGITGWVAEHRVAVNLGDAAKDPRADTIPGTEDDLDESMLLAPMTFDDRVLGVVVLSKLGLDQFTDDDLRLLVIYASFAAQAMANADTTEELRRQQAALERQVRGQRELLQITESILSTLDGRAVLEGITERLGGLVSCDNIAIEVVDPSNGLLTPLTARGIHAEHYMLPWEPGETGLATWVVEHNEATYVADERNDPRVNHFRDEEIQDGSMVVVPLRGREGAIGVLTMERLGVGNAFDPDEIELVHLFAAQVSIALQNAEVFRAVERRAQTDDLTGLLNHGTFEDRLGRAVLADQPFSLIMLDLDDFRDVNNSLGHQAGDQVLRDIAAALVRAGRETDQIFRYGGDEFTFLLPGTDATGARLVAERAASAIRAAGGRVSASIGIATYPVDGDDTASILLAADRACFVAKRGGRDRIATAAEGEALATEFSLQAPTPIDPTGTA